MPVEGAVAKIEDLNAAWPLDTDARGEGDDHLRRLKTAVASLLDGTNGVRQLGFDTVEQTLTTASTEITYGGLIQRGAVVAVVLKQDGTGGRLVTWDAAVFKYASTEIGLVANSYSIYTFVGHSDGYLWMTGVPRVGVS